MIAAVALAAGLRIAANTHAPMAPLPTLPVFVSFAKGITFRAPAGSTYCPLPDDWSGSDHGTIMFLRAPRACGSAGFPSSSRDFEPYDTPRIEVYYDYWMDDGNFLTGTCQKVGVVQFLGRPRLYCRNERNDQVIINIWSRYKADMDAEVAVTLVTNLRRESRDMSAFRFVTASMRSCTATWVISEKFKETFTMGTGAVCPKNGGYF